MAKKTSADEKYTGKKREKKTGSATLIVSGYFFG